MKVNHTDHVAVLEQELNAFRQAAAKRDKPAMIEHAETLSQLALGVAECLDPTTAPPEDNLVAIKEGCVGHGITPFTAEENAAANEILTVLMLGLDHATSIQRFRDWCRHADPDDLEGTVADIRLRFFDECPAVYIPKSTAGRILAEHKAGR
jgi:hypothetical protein